VLDESKIHPKKNILIWDNDTTRLEELSQSLSRLGHIIHATLDVDEALSFSTQQSIQLVIAPFDAAHEVHLQNKIQSSNENFHGFFLFLD
jgi:PleD family two-component response regulator